MVAVAYSGSQYCKETTADESGTANSIKIGTITKAVEAKITKMAEIEARLVGMP